MTHGIQRLDLSEAQQLLSAKLQPIGSRQTGVQHLGLDEARHRIAAQTIVAPISLPPFRSSAMDGYAAKAQDLTPQVHLRVVGVSAAGHPFMGQLQTGECVRVLTGAVVPDSADCVIIQEDVDTQGPHPEISGVAAAIQARVVGSVGANIRLVGHDVSAGATLVSKGTRLGAFELAWLAACGIAKVPLYPKLRVGLLATGDELQTPGTSLAPGQIFDSNRLLVRELLANLPIELVDLGIVADEKTAVERSIRAAAKDVQALISTGGVSVGDADYITEVVSEMGELEFWRLNLKPGKPMAVGTLGNRQNPTWFFGLPGNPVSCAVTALLIAAPALRLLCGATPTAPLTMKAQLTGAVTHKAGRQEFIRGRLNDAAAVTDELANWVTPTGDQSSNRLASFQQADCLVSIPKDVGNLDAGSWVDVLPLATLLE